MGCKVIGTGPNNLKWFGITFKIHASSSSSSIINLLLGLVLLRLCLSSASSFSFYCRLSSDRFFSVLLHPRTYRRSPSFIGVVLLRLPSSIISESGAIDDV
ncbi:uncharacterized protein G2W53_005229 [Senna tora]|uniref:Uncharacterized protein n=1 Tax=Senna tora TaxID=362788 RepID=A0A834XFC3_9FABA|nr:uncharacterized protein G2W53_005229 [Senna tora]